MNIRLVHKRCQSRSGMRRVTFGAVLCADFSNWPHAVRFVLVATVATYRFASNISRFARDTCQPSANDNGDYQDILYNNSHTLLNSMNKLNCKFISEWC